MKTETNTEMKTEFKNVEWVFQFNDNNPVHLAEPSSDSGAKELTLTIGNTAESTILLLTQMVISLQFLLERKR
jgi:hypothetical protein